jgi:signal transduction histidine kinase
MGTAEGIHEFPELYGRPGQVLIRTKILLILFSFVAIVLAMGVSYLYFNGRQEKYYRDTENLVKARELLKTASGTFDEQARSYDYYMYLNENTEKHTFAEKKSKLIKEMDEAKGLEIEGLDEIRNRLDILNSRFSRSFNIIENYSRTAAIRQTEKDIIPEIQKIKKDFKGLIAQADFSINESRTIAASYKDKVTRLFLVLFGVGIIIISVFSFDIYRTITKPLDQLQAAARELGQGKLDYKVDINTKNEFSNIADSFNQMAKDLKEFHLRITHMGKMAAIGELAGGVAHEINNPLTGILGNAQILLSKVASDNEVFPVLKKIERASVRCRDIVSDLLDFSRQQESEIESVNINRIIDDVFMLCESEIVSRKIQPVRDYASGLPKVGISPRAMQHAFLNIINNAIKAMPKGGKLTVHTALTSNNGKDYVEIKFTDTGCGFDEEKAQHLFEPFYTTREVGEGTGLGLSLTYRIIKNHDGFITAHSDGPDRGATFTILLPA